VVEVRFGIEPRRNLNKMNFHNAAYSRNQQLIRVPIQSCAVRIEMEPVFPKGKQAVERSFELESVLLALGLIRSCRIAVQTALSAAVCRRLS
jgi:hypothetical protein